MRIDVRYGVWGLAASLLAMGIACGPADATYEEGESTSFVRSPDAIANKYIVLFHNEVRSEREIDATSDTLSIEYGARVERRYRHAVHGFAGEMSEADAIVAPRGMLLRSKRSTLDVCFLLNSGSSASARTFASAPPGVVGAFSESTASVVPR